MAEQFNESIWQDYYKLFQYAFTKDPLGRKIDVRDLSGAGISQPDAIPSMGPDGSMWGGGEQRLVRYRESNDFIDLSTINNRPSRYKEYERLRSVPEIEMAMTVFADEACVAGSTKIATPFGFPTIEWLCQHKAKERFLVYCWDFEKRDYTLGWAFDPRIVRKAKTVKVSFDDGSFEIVTPDHRLLLKNGEWTMAGNLVYGSELMPFYRLKPNQNLTNLKHHQFPRIFTNEKGWMHERQLVDEWRTGKQDPKMERVNKCIRLISAGLNMYQICDVMKTEWKSVKLWLRNEGFSFKEIKELAKLADRRRVVGVEPWKEMDVYDLSVEKHQNFASESIIFHNCQKDENGHVFKIECANRAVVDELEFLFYNRAMLNYDRRMWSDFKNLCIFGDLFYELVINPDQPTDGVLKLTRLPPESIYRIQTTKDKILEFQQSKEGPDYNSLLRTPVVQATDAEVQQSTAIRFAPEQICHIRIGDDRKTFFPYGVSLIEAARGPAHSLRLMEDAMLVYRLSRAPERRVFYIDVGQLPPFKAEAFIERMKDQFRKKKVATNRSALPGANQVEERWHAPAADEDYWLPIRPNSNTKIDTLPGAQNLGEIDDAVYFRNKLFTALNFPKNYFSNEDPGATRITLSAQDIKFARMIERLQAHMEDGLWEIADRHLTLRGFPQETYDDLRLRMTAPSEWRELSRAEVVTNRINNASSIKGSQLMADFDIHTKWMRYDEDETQEMLARLQIQKLNDLKLQVLAQNPQLLGVGIPGQPQPGQELGTQAGGPSPMISPDGQQPPGQQPPPNGPPDGQQPPPPPTDQPPPQSTPEGTPIPDAELEDIKKYDLEIQDYDYEMDNQSIDYSLEER